MDPALGMNIAVSVNGPYIVSGDVPMSTQTIVVDDDGASVDWQADVMIVHRATYALCRCGQSATKPFCDGAHVTVGFDGTETATQRSYEAQATVQIGPILSLSDVPALCAGARFCDAGGSIWDLVDTAGGEAAVVARGDAERCPSGRLVVSERDNGVVVEPNFGPSICMVRDPSQGVAGPIWVRGGIPISSGAGDVYEVRNRVTLCRCGASSNKPFCDASHVSIGFTDADAAAPKRRPH
jgi:CDGSH-type Zn-finger protein